MTNHPQNNPYKLKIMRKIANKISNSDQSKVLLIFINPTNSNQKKIKAQ